MPNELWMIEIDNYTKFIMLEERESVSYFPKRSLHCYLFSVVVYSHKCLERAAGYGDVGL